MKNPHCFVALYEGDTVASAVIVGATTNPEAIQLIAHLIAEKQSPECASTIERARRSLLNLLARKGKG